MNSPFHIEATLDRLERFSNTSKASIDDEQQQLYLYYSKLAILELSGWVEDRIDELVLSIVADNTTDEGVKRKFALIVEQYNNFSYEQHFWRLLGTVVGVINIEEVENSISSKIRGNFRRVLNELKQRRNFLAHKSLQGTQQKICDLSETKRYYRHICDGLEAYEKAITIGPGISKVEKVMMLFEPPDAMNGSLQPPSWYSGGSDWEVAVSADDGGGWAQIRPRAEFGYASGTVSEDAGTHDNSADVGEAYQTPLVWR